MRSWYITLLRSLNQLRWDSSRERERCISCLARLLSATDVWVETYYLLSLAKSFSHSIFTVAAVVSPAVRRLRASPTKTVCCHHHPQRAQKRFRRGGRCSSSRRLKKKLLLTRFGDHSISLCVVEVATFLFWWCSEVAFCLRMIETKKIDLMIIGRWWDWILQKQY